MIIKNKEIIIYDFETDGFFSLQGYNRPIEVAVLHFDLKEFKLINKIDKLIKRRNNAPLPEKIVEITGITTEMLKSQGSDIQEVFKELNDVFNNSSDKLVIGHNILKFDNRFLNQRFAKYEYRQLPNDVCFDTAGQFKAELLNKTNIFNMSYDQFHMEILNIRAKGVKYNMGAAIEYYEIDEPIKRHRAYVDILYNLKVFIKQMEFLNYEDNKDEITYLDKMYNKLINERQKK